MKKQSTGLFSRINTKELDSLTSIVSETLATGLGRSENKIFTTADLWNIQRQGKSRKSGRMLSY